MQQTDTHNTALSVAKVTTCTTKQDEEIITAKIKIKII